MGIKLQRGFSAVEIVIAVFVVAAIGVTGYMAYSRMKDANKTPSASDQTKQAVTPAAPTISDSKDLDAADTALDETNLDASTTDETDLDAELNSF